MSNRRRMLMAIANQFKWLPYSYEYLYHDLVPETISSKSVKNKAKVSVIEANGVVENNLAIPLNNDGWTAGSPYVSATSATDSKFSGYVSSLPNDIGILGLFNYRFDPSNGFVSAVSGHKYLLSFNITFSRALNNLHFEGYGNNSQTSLGSVSANTKTFKSYIYTASSSSTYFKIIFDWYGTSNIQANDTFTIENLNLIDLTQMFGTGNEPTTLTDNRIQALLNRGYIPYNTGAYKGTDIGLFSSEPYNLCDKDFSAYSYGDDYLKYNSNNSIFLRAGTYVIERSGGLDLYCQAFSSPNTSDYLLVSEAFSSTPTNTGLIWSNHGWQTSYASTESITFTLIRSCYLTFCGQTAIRDNVCIHIADTRTGYAPHQSFTPIAFRYQGNGAINAHDTMTVTKDNVVFEKNVNSYNLGDYPWSRQYAYGRYEFYTVKLRGVAKSSTANVICSNYTVGDRTDLANKQMAFESDGTFCVRDDTYTTQSDFLTAVTGTYIEYELATPQTITIPRKHLGVVDLGTLEWNYDGAEGRFYTRSMHFKKAANGNTVGNIYCEKYISATNNGITFSGVKNAISIADDGNLIKCQSGNGTDAAAFKQAQSGVYLFYETENEVADILDKLDIEAGGTVNANWFSWVENQNIPDNIESVTIYGYTAQITNGVITITKNAAGDWGNMLDTDYILVAGHKYLYYDNAPSYAKIKFSTQGSPTLLNSGTITTITTTSARGAFVRIDSETDSTGWTAGTTITFIAMLIDLTLAFGSGNEPTSVNDPRIQYILNKGYIPTNTTGTYKLVDCEVLPNVEFKVKCK